MTEASHAEFLRKAAEARSRIRQGPAEVALGTDQENKTLIDVRGSDAHAENHLARALDLPLGQSPEQISSDLPDRHAAVVCYYTGGNRGMP